MTHFHTGKRDARNLLPGTPRMSDLLKTIPAGTVPAPPHNWGHGFAFGNARWLMLANGPCDDGTIPQGWYVYNGAGCCAWSGPGHEEMEAARTSKRPIPKFTCFSTATQYAHYLGLADAQALTAANDAGSDVQEVLGIRQTTGLLDADGNALKIGQHIALTPGNMQELWTAAWLFENVGLGVQLQQAQEDQFNAGKAWDYVLKWQPPRTVGDSNDRPRGTPLTTVRTGRSRPTATPGADAQERSDQTQAADAFRHDRTRRTTRALREARYRTHNPNRYESPRKGNPPCLVPL
jgi:hypothetical protein